MIDFKKYNLGHACASFSLDEASKNLILYTIDIEETVLEQELLKLKYKNTYFVDKKKNNFGKELAGIYPNEAICYQENSVYDNPRYFSSRLYFNTCIVYAKNLNEETIENEYLNQYGVVINGKKLKEIIHDAKIRDEYKIKKETILKTSYQFTRDGHELLAIAIALSSYRNTIINLASNKNSNLNLFIPFIKTFQNGISILSRDTANLNKALLDVFDNLIMIDNVKVTSYKLSEYRSNSLYAKKGYEPLLSLK